MNSFEEQREFAIRQVKLYKNISNIIPSRDYMDEYYSKLETRINETYSSESLLTVLKNYYAFLMILGNQSSS